MTAPKVPLDCGDFSPLSVGQTASKNGLRPRSRKTAASYLPAILIVIMMTSVDAQPPGEQGQLGSGRVTEADIGTVLNICEAPYFADPTGRKDCTGAILRAMDDSARKVLKAYQDGVAEVEALPANGLHRHPDSAESYREDGIAHLVSTVRLPYIPVIHFPEGSYLVSDTLRYRIKITNTYGSELNQQTRIRGAGVDRTVIRLRDRAPGFGEGTRKPVISYLQSEQTNVATSNYCEDLTINCGGGNPGAVGIDFFANNSGAVRNVRIVSEDGAGFAGLQLGHNNYSGVLIKHVEVRGFDHGLHVDSGTGGMFAHAEDITTRGQRVSGVTVGAISLSLRKLHTGNVPVALTCTSQVGHTVLLDSELEGSGAVGIDRKAGSLYVSNVTLKGFADARRIDEWVHPRAFGDPGGCRAWRSKTPRSIKEMLENAPESAASAPSATESMTTAPPSRPPWIAGLRRFHSNQADIC